MGDTSEQIVRQIEQHHRDLRDNMVELEEKVTRAVDWRSHVEQRPLMMVGLAFGGGVLLSALLGGRSRRRQRATWPAQYPDMPEDPGVPRRNPEDSKHTHRERTTSSTWDNLKGALVGVAVAKAGSVVEQLLPGFHDEYQKVQAGTVR